MIYSVVFAQEKSLRKCCLSWCGMEWSSQTVTGKVSIMAQSRIHRPKRNTPGPEAKVLLLYQRLGKRTDTGDKEKEIAKCPLPASV